MALKKTTFLFISLLITSMGFAQKKTTPPPTKASYPAEINRPKLVVGLVIDQMRWDYLYRYYNRYSQGGFKRLINEGFSVENTFIPYIPTYTACGHTSIYTGSIPAINGVIANDWYDTKLAKSVYCTEDKTMKTIGSNTAAGQMSPNNELTTTITDELRLATNFKSKVIGISLKDRSAILPVGHTANAAYWYDGTSGNWITSSYYMNQLPNWIENYNAEKHIDKFYQTNWDTLYPIESYTESTSDDKPYEQKFKGEASPIFPHKLNKDIETNYNIIRATPFGNTMTLDVAKLAISAEKLGQNTVTDFLAISCPSTDYVGHQFGPNSIEAEDTYLRLDKDLESFFNYLDATIGKGNYLLFLTADHGVAHVPGFMAENKLPGGVVSESTFSKEINTLIEEKFKLKNAVITVMNNEVYFNKATIDSLKIDFNAIKQTTINYLKQQDGILNAVDLSNLATTTLPEEIKTRITNGYNIHRSGDIYFILKSNWVDGGYKGTSHGAWNAYDAHIPLVFMGWNIKAGKTNRNYYMTDIAATLAAMLHIQMPSGSIGQPIIEITK